MSFSGRTPESLLPRSDSKNPATTCKGITTSGRPCRRALGSTSSPSATKHHGDATSYCWQHKDQATDDVAQQEEHSLNRPSLQQKSSLDTLVDRVGSINLNDGDSAVVVPLRKNPHRSRKSGNSHQQSQLVTVPEEPLRDEKAATRTSQSQYRHGRSDVAFSWACCLRTDHDDRDRRPVGSAHRRSRHSHERYHKPPQMMYQVDKRTGSPSRRRQVLKERSEPPTQSQSRSQTTLSSDTQTLLALIPKSLNPQITSTILAELSRPISPSDEAGYIYIFWLTPDSDTSPDDETASTLLDDNDNNNNNSEDRSGSHFDRRDAVIQRYASVHRRPPNLNMSSALAPKRTLMVKIGRAQNVHRRMSQWTKQCGQNITLIRYYPHHQAQASLPRKVPCVARVERLIHLELADARALRGKCEQCGREHREWFVIEASRTGLRGLDEVVKRWVGWADRWGAAAIATTAPAATAATTATNGNKQRYHTGNIS